jgi:hypothetical protein
MPKPETGGPSGSESSNGMIDTDISRLVALLDQQLLVLRRMDQRFEAAGESQADLVELVITTVGPARSFETASA